MVHLHQGVQTVHNGEKVMQLVKDRNPQFCVALE